MDASPEKNAIEIMDTGVQVRQLLIPRSDIADYLRAVPDEDRVVAFIHAVEVGVFCLERSQVGADMEFVRRQVDGLLDRVQHAVSAVPGSVETRLIEKLGTAEGQVLAPVNTLVRGIAEATDGRLTEIRDLFAREIDPGREASTLGAALKAIRELLDPKRKDSIQGSFESALQTVTARDGTLATAIRGVVVDAIRPLKEEVDGLSKDIQRQQGMRSVIERTTEKGTPFEEEVVALLQPWAKLAGAALSHVGPDKRPGDIVVDLPSDDADIRLVIEARDRESQPAGRTSISNAMNRAMTERDASLGIYLSRTLDGLAKEVGEWAEGAGERGLFVATTEQHLTTAIRFLFAQQRLAAARALRRQIDVQAVEAHVARIRSALVGVRNINTNVTKGREVLDGIQAQAEALRTTVRDALDAIEGVLRSQDA